MNATDDFTGDVMTMVMSGPRDVRLAIMQTVPKDELPQFIRSGILRAIAPEVLKTSAFVQQIVARALVEHVDWEAVSTAAATDENSN